MKNITFIITILIISNISKVQAQIHNVFKQNEHYVNTGKLAIGEDYWAGVIMFNDSLTDGKWNYYDVKDSTVKNYKSFLAVEGSFKNFLREGEFRYYNTLNLNKSNRGNQLRLIVNYSNGILDGYFCAYKWKYKSYEGFYSKGKKNGYFVWYFDEKYGDNGISKIEHYKNDVLQDWVEYNQVGAQIKYGFGVEQKK